QPPPMQPTSPLSALGTTTSPELRKLLENVKFNNPQALLTQPANNAPPPKIKKGKPKKTKISAPPVAPPSSSTSAASTSNSASSSANSSPYFSGNIPGKNPNMNIAGGKQGGGLMNSSNAIPPHVRS